MDNLLFNFYNVINNIWINIINDTFFINNLNYCKLQYTIFLFSKKIVLRLKNL
jgi:hypothetical protein